MSFENRLRDDLHRVPVPPTLVPPPGLADRVLLGNRRRMYWTNTLVAGTAVAAGLAVVGAATLVPGPGTPSAPVGAPSGAGCLMPFESPPLAPVTSGGGGSSGFPQPGGGPRAVEVYRSQQLADGGSSYLLDPSDGTYHELPFPWVLLSPDGTAAAVAAPDGRIGVATRAGLIDDGQAAVTWIGEGNAPLWSPDGAALVFVSLKKDPVFAFTAHRYDVTTGVVTDTVIPDSQLLIGSQVGWAADSQRYLALYRVPGDSFVVGSPRYLNPDGTLGEAIDVPGGLVGGAEAYAPSGRYLIIDSTLLMTDEPSCARVVDVATGTQVAELPRGMAPVGWYDDTALLAMAGGHLLVVDLASLSVVDQFEPGAYWPVQVGPTPEAASQLGF